MKTSNETADVRPYAVAFVQIFDATVFARTVAMTETEGLRLRSALQAL